MNRQIFLDALASLPPAFRDARPYASLLLGSGWNRAVGSLRVLAEVPYSEIAGFGAATVVGHAGKLVWCRAAGIETFLFMGRRHYYEGIGWNPVAIPAFLLKSFGAKAIFLTNAAGGINPDWTPGDLMIIDDHINMMGVTPLLGDHAPFWGPRFPDQSRVYDRDLRAVLVRAAAAASVPLREGIYLAGTGPTYETPAEIRAWRALGADAVGMSTVPEAMLANAAGLRVLGLSCITNMASGILDQPLTHEEVTETTRRAMSSMTSIIRQFWNQLALENAI